MSESKKELFGTDGIRGHANSYPMTSEVALQVGAATAHVLVEKIEGQHRTTYPRPRVILGKDTRVSSYMIEQAIASGICSAGADVLMVGPLPTPAIAFLTRSMRADAGIMVSASHNPYQDNGIKIFDNRGLKLADEIEKLIERKVLEGLEDHREIEKPSGDHIGQAVRIDDAQGRYIENLKKAVPTNFQLDSYTLAVDCAHGAAYAVAPILFRELGAKVIKIAVEPDGTNINKESGSLYPELAAKAVLKHKAQIGISLDGDADRVILCDENGERLDGDQIMGICALEIKAENKLTNNTMVITPMSNKGFVKTMEKAGIKTIESAVGDRYVTEKITQNNLNFGGEQSGHIIFFEHSSTGDGLLAALKVLEIMVKKKQPLSQLKKQIPLLPQVREDVKVKEKVPFEKLPKIKNIIEEAKKKFNGNGRVFVRYSGTENLVRIMLEGEDYDKIHKECKRIADAFASSSKT